MLLEFKVKNYKTFVGETIFSLEPAPKQKEFKYSILKKNANKKVHDALCSSIIYGPNAVGKTNLIGAIDTLKKIILRGNINDSFENNANASANALSLIPNKSNSKKEPVLFSIKFINEGFLFEYDLKLDLGKFLESNYERKILNEILIVNNETFFQRNGKNIIFSKTLTKFYQHFVDKNNSNNLFNKLLNDEFLFVHNIKSINPKIYKAFADWIINKLLIIYHGQSAIIAPNMQNGLNFDPKLDKILSAFGISNKIGYLRQSGLINLISVISSNNNNEVADYKIPSIHYESYGTLKLAHLFPAIISNFLNGGTTIVDELDSSLHPAAISSLVTIFHNNTLNLNQAQLIFNTHNPIYLGYSLFRRDEIKFIDFDEENTEQKSSILYSLSDFKTYDNIGRKQADYLKNYANGSYGAIKDVDFSPAFSEIINSLKEKPSDEKAKQDI